jgi:hypothetical protein
MALRLCSVNVNTSTSGRARKARKNGRGAFAKEEQVSYFFLEYERSRPSGHEQGESNFIRKMRGFSSAGPSTDGHAINPQPTPPLLFPRTHPGALMHARPLPVFHTLH